MASKMYVDQLKDVLVHSTSKKVAGFIAEPIQVRVVCDKMNGKIFDLDCFFNLLLGCWRLSSPSQGFPEGRIWADTRERWRVYFRWGMVLIFTQTCEFLLVQRREQRLLLSIAGADRIWSPWEPLLGFWNSRRCTGHWYAIAHFRVLVCLGVKTSLGAKPFISKWVIFAWKWTFRWNKFT